MNWKLIGTLSLLGLLMGVGTVFIIPSNVEPIGWIVVFVVSAMQIAQRGGARPFTAGVLTGLANCVWVTGAHVLFVDHYLAWHPREAAMMTSMPMPDSPRLMMLMVGPAVGLISGGIIGVLAVVAAKLLPKR